MAKARSIGGIYASLSLRDEGFKKSLKSARSGLTSFKKLAEKNGQLIWG